MNISTIVTQMTILLLLMIVGFIAMKRGILNEVINNRLSAILLKIGIPGLVISSVKDGTTLTGTELFHTLIIFSIFCIFIGVLSKIIVELAHIQENKPLWQFIILFTNAGFMGLPVVQTVLGNEAMLLAAIFLLPINVLMYGYGESLFTDYSFSIKKMMNGPMIASVIALVICIFNIHLPYIIGQTVTYIGNITTPLSMMIIGAGLVKMDVKELFDIRMWGFTIFKMILLPLFYILVLSFFDLDSLAKETIILVMCMPVASNAAVYANMYDQDSVLASKLILMTSIACVVTIPIVFTIYNVF